MSNFSSSGHNPLLLSSFLCIVPYTGYFVIEKEQNLYPKSGINLNLPKKKVSLKTITLHNKQQKVNDALGNPIIIGAVVIWKVVDPAKAVFNVDNYRTYLSIQCDSTIRKITRLYPYDLLEEDEDEEKHERTLRGSSQEIAKWADDDFRSINGQIEYLLSEAVRKRKKS